MDFLYHGKEEDAIYSSVSIHTENSFNSSTREICDYLETDNFKTNKNSPLVLADFGTGDGCLALKTYKFVLESVKERLRDREVIIILNDVAGRNLSVLSKQIKASGIQEESGVAVLLSTQDFFNACCPSSYIDVSTCNVSLHYVGSLKIENELFYTCNDVTDAERKLFKEQMQDNWRRFLTTRSRELKQGGRLCVSYAMDGWFGKGSLFQIMSDTWRYLHTNGIITLNEFKKGTVGVYYPTKDDITSVFVDSVYSGLKLLKFEYYTAEPWWTQTDSHGQPACSPAVFAENLTSLVQTWSRCYIEEVFNESESRPSSEKEDIVDTFYRKTQEAVEKRIKFISDPIKYGQVLLQKIS